VVNRKHEFKMMELVRANPLRRIQGEYSVYSANHLSIDILSLAYFTLSVTWRGGAHNWPTF